MHATQGFAVTVCSLTATVLHTTLDPRMRLVAIMEAGQSREVFKEGNDLWFRWGRKYLGSIWAGPQRYGYQKEFESRHSKKNCHLSTRSEIKFNVPISKTLPFFHYFFNQCNKYTSVTLPNFIHSLSSIQYVSEEVLLSPRERRRSISRHHSNWLLSWDGNHIVMTHTHASTYFKAFQA